MSSERTKITDTVQVGVTEKPTPRMVILEEVSERVLEMREPLWIKTLGRPSNTIGDMAAMEVYDRILALLDQMKAEG